LLGLLFIGSRVPRDCLIESNGPFSLLKVAAAFRSTRFLRTLSGILSRRFEEEVTDFYSIDELFWLDLWNVVESLL